MTRSREIWFIGEARDRELRFCLREFERCSRGFSIELFSNIDEIPTDHSADLAVVLQERTHQYRGSAIIRLIDCLMPQGRLLCVYGSWCESDGRNADLWPHAVRVAARSAVERFGRELQAIADGEQPLPLTAGRDERFEHNHCAPPPALRVPVTAHVTGGDRTLCDSVRDRLRSAGLIVTESPNCDVVVRAGGIDAPGTQQLDAPCVDVVTMPTPNSGEHVVPMLCNDRQLIETVLRAAGR